MIVFLSWVALIVALPSLLYIAECLASLVYRDRRLDTTETSSLKTVILVPAHNEEAVIASTLESIQENLGENDRILVVADNCSDKTADIIRDKGVEVLERFDENDRGKGFALAHGINHMASSPPDMVIIVDADCHIHNGALATLKQHVVALDAPVQARYLIQAPEGASIATKVSEFAVLVKNRVRSRGLSLLGIPIPLLGTGMAFKWKDITLVPLASGEIVEDMKLGIELAAVGRGAKYCDEAMVTSYFPSSAEAQKTQRERWEHGHLGLIQTFSKPLLAKLSQKFSIKLSLFTVDLFLPPLTLLIFILVMIFAIIAGLSYLSGDATVLTLSAYLLVLFFGSLTLVWAVFGRSVLSAKEILHIPVYVISKIFIYTKFLKGRQTRWIRTDRD